MVEHRCRWLASSPIPAFGGTQAALLDAASIACQAVQDLSGTIIEMNNQRSALPDSTGRVDLQ